MSGIFLAELSAGLLPNILPSAYSSLTGSTLPPLTYSASGQSFALSTIGAASGFKSLAWTTDPDVWYEGVSNTVELNGSGSPGVFTLEAGAQYAVSFKAQVVLSGSGAGQFGAGMSVSILSSSGETVLGISEAINEGWTNTRVTVLIDRRTATGSLVAWLKLLSWHAGGTLYLSEFAVRKISTAGSKTWYFSNGQGFNRTDWAFNGVNLLSAPLDFSQAVWNKVSASVSAVSTLKAPDGTYTAESLLTPASPYGFVYQTVTASGTGTYTLSVWVHTSSTCTQVELRIEFQSSSYQSFGLSFNPQTGESQGTAGALSGSYAIKPGRNGWMQVSITATGTVSSNTSVVFMVVDWAPFSSTILSWGRRAEPGTLATPLVPAFSAFYLPRIQQPATVTRSINVAQIGLGAAGGISYGELTLMNVDGALDGLDADPVDGRQLRLLYGDDGDDYSQFSTVLVAAIEGYSWERELLSVRLRDPGAVLDQPVNLNTYTVDARVGSFEGYAEIKGKPKPLTFGYAHGFQPVLIDATKRIYQYHDGDATGATLYLYQQNGMSLGAGAAYTSAADVLNDSLKPAPGYFRAYPAKGVFRLSTDIGGLDYQGSIHADISWPSNTNSGSLMQTLASQIGLTVMAADVTALDAAYPVGSSTAMNAVGMVAMLGETVRSLLDQVAQGVIGWYGFDALGNLRVGTFRAPAGTPVATLTLSDLADYSRPVNDPATSLPRWRTTVNLGKNWAPLSKDQIYNAIWQYLSQPYRYTDVRNYYDNKATHPLATEITIDTLFKDMAPGVTTLADDVAALFSVRRDTVQVTVNYSGNRFAAIDLNSVVSLAIPRWGYDSGKLMRVIAITDDRQRGKLDLTLWG